MLSKTADLTARFQLIDEISNKLAAIANSGQNMVSQLEQAGSSMNSVYGDMSSGAATASVTANNVTCAISSIGSAASSSASDAASLVNTLDSCGDSAEAAANAADTLANAEGQSTKAAQQQEQALKRCEEAASQLEQEYDASIDALNELSAEFDKARDLSEEVAESDAISTRTKLELTQATEEAAQALKELENAQTASEHALQQYNQIAASGKGNIEELSRAEEMVTKTSGLLAEANKKATSATERLGEASRQAGEEVQNAGGKGAEAMQGLASVLTSLGIAKGVQEITDGLLDCNAAAAQVETSTAKVQTIMDSSQASLDDIEASVKALSADTGTAVSELNNTVYDAISATSDTANSVTTVSVASKLATAGFAETGNALSVLSTITNSYKMEASELTNISDSLIQTQNLGVTTVGDLSVQMGRAIATASAYSVNLYNLEAAYIATTKSGIATAESTTYISSMLNELGDSGSEVATILQENTGKTFGQMMQDGYSLSDALGILQDSVNGDAEAMMNLWGSAEAGKAAAAVVNQGLDTFNANLNALQNSCGLTEMAYETMANTNEFAQQRMVNSAELLKVAVGDDLNPVFMQLYNTGADILQGAANIAEKCPVLTAAITGITAAGTILLAGIAAYNVAIPVATAVTAAFNKVLEANPAILIVAGVVAATAAVATFTSVMSVNTQEQENWSSTTRQQMDDLDNLTREYESACDTYGETSEEALRLKYQIDDLSDSIEANGQTMEQFVAQCDSVVSAHEDMVSACEESMNAQRNNGVESMALVQKLSDLASQTEITDADTAAMNAIISELNGTYSDLNLTLDQVMSNTDDVVGSLKEMAQAQADAELQQEAMDNYVSALKDQARVEAQLTNATAEQDAAQKRLNTAQEAYNALIGETMDWDGSVSLAYAFSDEAKELERAQKSYNEATAAIDELNDAKAETESILADIDGEWEEEAEAAKAAMEGTADVVVSSEEAVQNALESVGDELSALMTAYEEAYDSAYASISGQYDLWDDIGDIADTSMSELNDSLDAQISYWESYASNLENLQGRNIEGLNELVASLNDGSEESAAALQAMAAAGDDDLIGMVDKYADLQNAQGETASAVADLETNFSSKLDEMRADLENAVNNMNCSDDAAAAAKETMNGYINSIKAKQADAVAAAKNVASAVAAALKSSASSGEKPSTKGFAVGTTNAPDVFVAGEEGPELIIDHPGATVFPKAETDRIINAVNTQSAAATAEIGVGNTQAVLSDAIGGLSGAFAASFGNVADVLLNTFESNLTAVDAYANGTTASSNMYIAGDDGPELILGKSGDTVFPSSETERILDAMEHTEPIEIDMPNTGDIQSGDSGEDSGEKHITLDINVAGAVQSGNAANKEEIVEVMVENLRPVLMEILVSELTEEGDGSYEF